MERVWLALGVVFYPLALPLIAMSFSPVGLIRVGRFSALASGLIVFSILWLYVLPRHLAWQFGLLTWESRFAMPLAAYLCGLAVAAILMWGLAATEWRQT